MSAVRLGPSVAGLLVDGGRDIQGGGRLLATIWR